MRKFITCPQCGKEVVELHILEDPETAEKVYACRDCAEEILKEEDICERRTARRFAGALRG